MAEPKYRTVKIPKPRSRGVRGRIALQKWQRSGGRQKQILNPETGKYVPALMGEAGQRQVQKLYPTDEGKAAEEKRDKLKKEQADRNIAGAAEAKKKAEALLAETKKKRKEKEAKAKAEKEAKAKADAEAKAAAESKIDIGRGPGSEAPVPPKPIRITEDAPKIALPDKEKIQEILKDLEKRVLSPDFKTPTRDEIAEAVTKATGGRYTPPAAKVAEPEPPKAEPVAVAPKATQELAMPTVIDIPGGGQIKIPSIPALKTVEAKKPEPVQAVKAEPVQTPTAVTRVPTPQAVLDANKAAGSPVADVLAIANAKKIGGNLNADQIRSLINEGKMDPDDDFFTDKEGIFGEPGLRYNKGVPETVVDQIVQDRQKAAYAAHQASGKTGPIFSVPDPQAKPLEEVAQQPTAPVVSAPTPEPTPEPAPSAPPPPQFVNMDPMQGFRETYIPTNVLGQAYDPSVRDAYTQKMMQAGANIQQGGYPMFKTPTSAIPQTQFGGYGAPMPIAPLMPYAGLAAPQPPQMASGAIVNPGTGEPMPIMSAPPMPRNPIT